MYLVEGLLGAGKSTLANLLQQRLCAAGRHMYVLDGDHIRQSLNRDLGFLEPDRVENIRPVTEVARLFVDVHLSILQRTGYLAAAGFTPYGKDLERTGFTGCGKSKRFEGAGLQPRRLDESETKRCLRGLAQTLLQPHRPD